MADDDALLTEMSLEEKIGQLLIAYVYGASADAVTDEQGRANLATYGIATPAEVVSKYKLGGVVLFRHATFPQAPNVEAGNLHDPTQIAALSNGLQEAARTGTGIGLLISVDQEGGRVTRVGPPATQFPSAAGLAHTGRPSLVEAAARVVGTELRAMGINQVFAPVADVVTEPGNTVIGDRSFGSDPGLVAEFVAAQVRGFTAAGVVSTAKHFPGHGGTVVDSHQALPIVDRTLPEWMVIDRPPFEAAVRAGTQAVMMGHLAVPALDASGRPATLSAPITDHLRHNLRFDGIIVTDSLLMRGVRDGRTDEEVAIQALEAGADMLLMPPDPTRAIAAITAAVKSGRLTEARIDQSLTRVLHLKEQLDLLTPPPASTDSLPSVIGSPAHQAVLAQVQEACRCSD